jgi:hypothetical protein
MSNTFSHFREQAALALAPFFGDGVTEDQALRAARSTIDSYCPRTPRELQLVAQIVAYGFGSLACLRSAMAAKRVPVKEMLRLQDAAMTLDRAAQKFTRALDAIQSGRQPGSPAWDDAGFWTAMDTALETMRKADSGAPKRTPPKLRIVSGEPMTPAVLARLRRGQ